MTRHGQSYARRLVMGYCAYHLRHIDKPEHLDWVERFLRLRSICFDTIERQGKRKWMTTTRMGL